MNFECAMNILIYPYMVCGLGGAGIRGGRQCQQQKVSIHFISFSVSITYSVSSPYYNY